MYTAIWFSGVLGATTPGTTAGSNATTVNNAMGVVALAVAFGFLALALGFSLLYHRRLLNTIDLAIKRGAKVSTRTDPALDGPHPDLQGREVVGESGISGPDTATVGVAADFEVENYSSDDPTKPVTWSVEGGNALPKEGTGPSITFIFTEAGNATVTASADSKNPITKKVAVKAAAVPSTSEPGGIVLPFVLANWGRLVVVTMGTGTVAALMTWGVISSDGGIGVIGTLLGAGAAAATGDRVARPNSGRDAPDDDSSQSA